MIKKNITACLIKELRSRTGSGFIECKRALLEENGNIERSIDNLRKSGKLTAEKKVNNVTKQGRIFSQIQNNVGAILELNCETDFVSKGELFNSLGYEIMQVVLLKKIKDIHLLKEIFEDKRISLISKLGENINIRRVSFLEDENILSYVHSFRIGVLVTSSVINKIVLKNIAMHIAASKPEYLSPEVVSKKVFQREHQIQLELVKKIKKPANILNKIIAGRMNKFVNSISLTSQVFIMDSTKTVGDVLNENHACIKSFIRFELGEIF